MSQIRCPRAPECPCKEAFGYHVPAVAPEIFSPLWSIDISGTKFRLQEVAGQTVKSDQGMVPVCPIMGVVIRILLVPKDIGMGEKSKSIRSSVAFRSSRALSTKAWFRFWNWEMVSGVIRPQNRERDAWEAVLSLSSISRKRGFPFKELAAESAG